MPHTENETPDSLVSRGMKTRREVLGEEYVDAAMASTTDFDADFQHFISATAWAGVWSRAGLSRRDRSLITITQLASLGYQDELALHLRASANTGLSRGEIKEALLHVAVYAGVPAANIAFKIAKQVFAEMAPPSAT
ncbi:MAG: 4-carboxymuconolactone decarboxylase [Pseudohongiellaceae bacterium]